MLRRYGLDKAQLEAVTPRVGELPFDSERKRMTTVHALPADPTEVPEPLREIFEVDRLAAPGGRVAFTKGALDGLLARCDTVDVGGTAVALDDEHRRRALAAGERLAARGRARARRGDARLARPGAVPEDAGWSPA